MALMPSGVYQQTERKQGLSQHALRFELAAHIWLHYGSEI